MDESPEQYRKDQAALAAAASSSVRAARRSWRLHHAAPARPAPSRSPHRPRQPRQLPRLRPRPGLRRAPGRAARRLHCRVAETLIIGARFFFSAQGGVDGLLSMEPLSALKARAAAGTLVYSKFVGIGLFRLLELTGATEPAALARLADASGAPLAKVNADLTLYKGLLSKLAAAKELMAEYLAREAKKTAQRMAEKEAKAAGSGEGTSASPA